MSTADSDTPPSTSKGPSGARRAYKACLNCRNRKAKCDLGDLDRPKSPPCARCERERCPCEFAASRRGGNKRGSKDGSTALVASKTATFFNGFTPTSPVGTTFPPPAPFNLHASPPFQGSVESPVSSNGQPNAKRRRTEAPPLNSESLAAASLRNPTDALNILALAAAASEGGDSDADPSEDEENVPALMRNAEVRLQSFPLVAKGFFTAAQISLFVGLFFQRHHPLCPIVPAYRIPRTLDELADFAEADPHLLTAFIVIASRHDKSTRTDPSSSLHVQAAQCMEELINDVTYGRVCTVGAVEAMLLLSENIPRQTGKTDEANGHVESDRMAWMFVGLSVRMGYMLGLDQKTLLPSSSPTDDPFDRTYEQLHRERLAWTYCYIFDRQISIRVGKAFWSRGPSVCFQSTANGAHPVARQNFPSMGFVDSIQDDYASLIQAHMELTQTLTNAHDLLFSTKDRTDTLVRCGEYAKYLDEFGRTLTGFKTAWKGKQWATFPISAIVWCSYHYLRLYIYAFAFQAHVQRATSSGDQPTSGLETSVFPRGLIGSPDARHIFEAIDAATELLTICTEQLHPGGALAYLPWRFFLYFSYAGVFLLKAVFVGAVVPRDQRAIIQLLRRLIVSLASASADEQHPAVRYARLLNSLLRALSRNSELNSQAPTGTTTPIPQGTPSQQSGHEQQPPLMSFAHAASAHGLAAYQDPSLSSAHSHPVSQGLVTHQAYQTPIYPPQQMLPEATGFHEFDFDMSDILPQVPAPDAFSQLLLSDETALDGDFWRAFSAQAQWPLAE